MIPTTHAGIEAAVDRHDLLLAYTPSHLNAVKGQALSASDLRSLLEARDKMRRMEQAIRDAIDLTETQIDEYRADHRKTDSDVKRLELFLDDFRALTEGES